MTAALPFQNPGPMLFALGASRSFGEHVGRELGTILCPHEEREFEDGEHKARPLVSVRGRDVYALHSLYGESEQSGNDKLCRLLFFIGALKDGAAARVTALVPYLAYARKDSRTKPRDPVITRYVASLFEAVGTDAVVTMDVHNLAAFQNAYRCVTENLEARPLLVAHILPILNGRDVIVAAPDAGAIKRADQFRHELSVAIGRPVGAAFAEKHRSDGIVSGDLFAGDVKGKDVVIVDDLVSTGTTLARTAHACKERGAARVLAVATHGLFSAAANAALADSALDRIIVTDSVAPYRAEAGVFTSKLNVVSCAPLFAQAIRQLHGEEALAP